MNSSFRDGGENREFLQGKAKLRPLGRDPVSDSFNPSEQEITFMNTDVDYYTNSAPGKVRKLTL